MNHIDFNCLHLHDLPKNNHTSIITIILLDFLNRQQVVSYRVGILGNLAHMCACASVRHLTQLRAFRKPQGTTGLGDMIQVVSIMYWTSSLAM